MLVCFSRVVRSVAWAAAGFHWVFAFFSLSACVVCQKVCVNPLHESNVISRLKARLQFAEEKSTSLIRYLLYSALNAWCIVLCMMFWNVMFCKMCWLLWILKVLSHDSHQPYPVHWNLQRYPWYCLVVQHSNLFTADLSKHSQWLLDCLHGVSLHGW